MNQSLAAILSSVFLVVSTAVNEVAAQPEKTQTGSETVAPPIPPLKPVTQIPSWNLQVRWDDSTKRESLIEDMEVTLTPGVPVQIGTEYQKNREISFTKGSGSSVSGGFSAGFGGMVESMSSQSVENKTGRATTETFVVTLNPDVCLNWRIKKFETAKVGYFSAPDAGMPEEQPVWVPLSRRIEAISKCPLKPSP